MSVWGKKDKKTVDNEALVPIGNKIGTGEKLPTLSELSELRQVFKSASTFTESSVTSDGVVEQFYKAAELKGYNDKLKLFTKGQQQVRRNALQVMTTALGEYQAVYRDTAALEQQVNRFGQQVAPQMLGVDANRADYKGYSELWDTELNKLIDW
jgi:hypothetical protein